MRLHGKLTISRWSGGDSGEIHIELTDERARCCAVEITIGMKEFAEAITALGARPCVFDFNNSGRVGTVGQNKQERVPVPPYEKRTPGWEAAALAPFEVDGWRARGGDITNSHCHTRDESGQNYQKVVFFRNVPATADDSTGGDE